VTYNGLIMPQSDSKEVSAAWQRRQRLADDVAGCPEALARLAQMATLDQLLASAAL